MANHTYLVLLKLRVLNESVSWPPFGIAIDHGTQEHCFWLSPGSVREIPIAF